MFCAKGVVDDGMYWDERGRVCVCFGQNKVHVPIARTTCHEDTKPFFAAGTQVQLYVSQRRLLAHQKGTNLFAFCNCVLHDLSYHPSLENAVNFDQGTFIQK